MLLEKKSKHVDSYFKIWIVLPENPDNSFRNKSRNV